MSTRRAPPTQASFIRSRLTKKAAIEKILAECKKRFPKGKVTAGYIRWIGKHTKERRASK